MTTAVLPASVEAHIKKTMYQLGFSREPEALPLDLVVRTAVTAWFHSETSWYHKPDGTRATKRPPQRTVETHAMITLTRLLAAWPDHPLGQNLFDVENTIRTAWAKAGTP